MAVAWLRIKRPIHTKPYLVKTLAFGRIWMMALFCVGMSAPISWLNLRDNVGQEENILFFFSRIVNLDKNNLVWCSLATFWSCGKSRVCEMLHCFQGALCYFSPPPEHQTSPAKVRHCHVGRNGCTRRKTRSSLLGWLSTCYWRTKTMISQNELTWQIMLFICHKMTNKICIEAF